MVKGVAFGFRRTCKGLDGFGYWIMCSGFSLSIQLQLSMSEIKRFFFVYPTGCCRDSVGFLGSSPELFFVSRVRCSGSGFRMFTCRILLGMISYKLLIAML